MYMYIYIDCAWYIFIVPLNLVQEVHIDSYTPCREIMSLALCNVLE